jgi:hypothetical protein
LEISSTQKINIQQITIQKSFENCCYIGNIDAAKFFWIMAKSSDKYVALNIHGINETIFNRTCQYGELETAKWLWDLSNEINSPINIHNNNEYVFRICCDIGHVNIVKWLWDLSKKINSQINIHIDDDLPFKKCCENTYNIKNKIEIAKFLCSLYKGYEIILERSQIFPHKHKIKRYNIFSNYHIPNDYRNKKLEICNEEDNIEI